MSTKLKYMASGKNKTGPICDKVVDAAKGYFKLYPEELVCHVSEGENCGNNIFIAKMGGQSSEILKEQVQ